MRAGQLQSLEHDCPTHASRRSRRRLSYWLLCAGVLVSALGCTGNALSSWRSRVTQYVVRQGHGNPSVLGETWTWRSPDTLRPAQPVIGELSGAGPLGLGLSGKDAQGVLVDSTRIGKEIWYIFLVGVVPSPAGSDPTPTDIRLVAMAARKDRLRWQTSRSNSRALEQYLRGRAQLIAATGIRSSGLGFPAPTDHFRLSVDGAVVTVTEARSKASWRLELK